MQQHDWGIDDFKRIGQGLKQAGLFSLFRFFFHFFLFGGFFKEKSGGYEHGGCTYTGGNDNVSGVHAF